MRRLLLISAAALCACLGCVEYNEACTAPVPDAKATYARLKAPLYIDKPNARHANNAFGQVAADAYRHAFDGTPAEANLGVINSGDIRNEGFCAQRNIIREKLLHGDVYEILLFDNLMYSLEVNEAQLVKAFQHSVNTLTAATTPGVPQEIASAPARFLQVSKDVSMTVDCKVASGSSQRVTSLKINGTAINLAAPNAAKKYRVAMPEFLMIGGDGYSMFAEAYNDPQGSFSQTPRNEKEAQLAANYLKTNFAGADKPVLEVEQRISLIDCAIPTAPPAP